MEHPDAALLVKANIVSTRMHINLGVIKNKNTAPWGLFKERKEGSNFPSAYSGGIKKSQASLYLFLQPEHKACLQ